MTKSARTAAAATATSAATENTSDPVVLDAAANDARPGAALPVFALTPKLRSRIAREAAKVPADAVKPMGSYAAEQVRWAGGLLATAWADLTELAGIPIGEGAPITRDELVAYGERLEFARERVSGEAAPLDGDPARLPDGALQRSLRGAHVTLADAIPLYLCGRTDDAAEQAREVCRSVRADAAKKSVSGNGARLNLLLDSNPSLGPWLARLPKGESSAIDVLRRLHPEWVRREQIAAGRAAPAPSDDGADRVWALMAPTRERILTAGRYLVSGRADREGAYRGFARPTPRRPRKADGDAKGEGKADATKPSPDATKPAGDATKPVTH